MKLSVVPVSILIETSMNFLLGSALTRSLIGRKTSTFTSLGIVADLDHGVGLQDPRAGSVSASLSLLRVF